MKRIINKLRIDNQIRFGYGTAFFLLLVSYLITLYANSQLINQAKLVDHSNKIIYHIETVLSSLKDGETAVRGFMIMKDSKFLGPYYTSRNNVDSVFKILREETADNSLQEQRLDTLSLYIHDRYSDMYRVVEHFPRSDFNLDDSTVLLEHQGRKDMEAIRSLAMRMQLHEENLLNTRSQNLSDRFLALNIIIIGSLFLAFLLVFLGFITYLRENKARRMADNKVDEYQEQLKQRIEQLAGANKELIQMRSIEKFAATGRIARTIAHEIRNPLTNINLAIEQIKSDIPDAVDDGVGVLFDMVTRNSNRINQLITDLLSSTKFAELDYEKVAIADLLDGAVELAKDRLMLNRINVLREYLCDCTVSVDIEKMRIALLNIIVNAIEAMEPGTGVLKLQISRKEEKCVITITDNGGGMDGEAAVRIFDPYFTTKIKGNGLGLTNTQNIILNHKGNISVESEKGKGTVFIITLTAE